MASKRAQSGRSGKEGSSDEARGVAPTGDTLGRRKTTADLAAASAADEIADCWCDHGDARRELAEYLENRAQALIGIEHDLDEWRLYTTNTAGTDPRAVDLRRDLEGIRLELQGLAKSFRGEQ